MRLKQVILVVVALMLLAPGCASDDTAAPTTSTTASTTTTTQPTTTVPTATTAPPTTTVPTTTTASPTTTSEPWDLVWISDSIGGGVATRWADRIEESEGVEVRVHHHIIPDLSIEGALQKLREATIREEVADAEIIVVYGNPGYSTPDDMGTCARLGGDPRDPPERYTSVDFTPYGDVFRDIFDEIFELRSGQPTVIRTFDWFAAALPDWREAGIEPECTAAWEAQAASIREAADEYGVGTAAFYDAFNGANHDEDAREKGYIRADGWHQSLDAGVAVQVEVLHALGYDPIIP